MYSIAMALPVFVATMPVMIAVIGAPIRVTVASIPVPVMATAATVIVGDHMSQHTAGSCAAQRIQGITL